MSHASARRTSWWVLLPVVALLLSACSSGGTPHAAAPSPTPIAELSTTGMRLPRIEFCRLVPAKAVTDALGGKADDQSSWGNGDKASVAPGTTDVVHELGCSWSTTGGATARAWLFAQPLDAAGARQVVAAARTQQGCTVGAGPTFGTPSLTQVCTTPAPRVRHAGLFGQTWLTCEVTGASGTSPTDVRQRADAWCVQVANSLDTGS